MGTVLRQLCERLNVELPVALPGLVIQQGTAPPLTSPRPIYSFGYSSPRLADPSFLVKPETLLRWHHCLAGAWT